MWQQSTQDQKNSPFCDRSHNEGSEARPTDGDAGGEGPLLLKVHRHAHDGGEVDQTEAKTFKNRG